eukprot:Hpha_TRINITY_DN8548_c0_g1::TRINITY_DN8548_c0_g1_i1::g.146279::m.146279/K00889/PIP5K; 1-phosphatidylinositol-4-phosphate 5-kinase
MMDVSRQRSRTVPNISNGKADEGPRRWWSRNGQENMSAQNIPRWTDESRHSVGGHVGFVPSLGPESEYAWMKALVACEAGEEQENISLRTFQRVLQLKGAPWAMLGRVPRLGALLYETLARRGPEGRLDVGTCALGLGTLCRGDQHERMILGFQICDRDGDGKISKDDIQRVLLELWQVMDSSGSRSGSNMQAFQQQIQSVYASLNPTQEGSVSFQEYCNRVEENPTVLNSLALRSGVKRRGSRPYAGVPSGTANGDQTAMMAIMVGIREALGPDRPKHLDELCLGDGCRFKMWCPEVFSSIRHLSAVTDGMFRSSLGIEGMLGSLLLGQLGTFRSHTSEAQSGCVFFESHDKRFLLKEMREKERTVLLSILGDYHKYLSGQPQSLLCRFFGIYSVDCGKGWQHFVAMANMFHPWADRVHRRYDLKGSNYRRTRLPPGVGIYDENAPKQLLDDDVRSTGKTFTVGDRKQGLVAQLCSDTAFLASHGLYDYSLLVGEGVEERGSFVTNSSAARPPVADSRPTGVLEPLPDDTSPPEQTLPPDDAPP